MTAPANTAAWQLDAAHTEVEFSVRHLMISNVKGRFDPPTGTVFYDPAIPGSLKLDVEIDVKSVDTRNAQRDEHLRSADFFDVATWPQMTFHGKRVEGDIGDRFKLIGDLTLHGVTKEISLDVHAEGAGGDPWGNERLGFTATGKLNRGDFGLHYNAALETGGVVLSDEVKLIINTELMRPKS